MYSISLIDPTVQRVILTHREVDIATSIQPLDDMRALVFNFSISWIDRNRVVAVPCMELSKPVVISSRVSPCSPTDGGTESLIEGLDLAYAASATAS